MYINRILSIYMVVKLSMASEFLYNYITCKSLELVFEASLWHV